MLLWQKSYETGYEPIDREHRLLVERLNVFGESLSTGTGKDQLFEMLAFLETYTQRHFAHEESCMAKFRCPTAKANLSAHQQFLTQVAKVRAHMESNGASTAVAISLHDGLCKWIRDHIMRIDAPLGKCIPKHAATRRRRWSRRGWARPEAN